MKKNRFLVVILILALFIPSYIGVYSYIHTNKKPVTPDTATGVTISDIAGKSYNAAADSDIAKLLNRINTSSTPLAEPPAALSGAQCSMTVPNAPPDIRLSVMRTKSFTPCRYSFFGIGR